MDKPFDPSRERPNTYVVQDRSNLQEVRRLQLQERLMTVALGGLLPEQPDLTRFESVLDMACGAGGWLVELAQNVPSISRLVGADISQRMVEVAREEAEVSQVQDRVEFRVMDALRLW